MHAFQCFVDALLCAYSDFHMGIIVPLLKNKHSDATQLEMYRGITIFPVLSKLFELVLLRHTSPIMSYSLVLKRKVVVHMHYLLSMSLSDTSLVMRPF